MLKWFKERKKRRKSSKTSKLNPDDDESEHIYAEIVDLPRLTNVEGWVRSCNSESTESESEKNQSADDLDVDDPGGGGPYMVVPLIAGNQNKNQGENLTSFGCSSSSTPLSRWNSALSGSTGSSSSSSSSAADFSYDSGTCHQRSEGKSEQSARSCNTHKRRSKSQYSAGSSGSSSITDSCFEYDVKTSSEDEQANDYFISKMKENLQLKYSLQETIRVRRNSTDTLDQKLDDVISGVFCDSADVDAALSFSNHDADDGTLADQSDSDNSSGYYDSCLRKRDRVHSSFPSTSSECGAVRDNINLYDTPDMGTICLSVSRYTDASIDSTNRPRKLERSKIKTVCTPKVFDINVESKSAFRPVQNSKVCDGFRSRTLSYKRNSSVSSRLSCSLKSDELETSVCKSGERKQLKQRSRSMDNLHILSSAICAPKTTRVSTPGCQRKFSQLSVAPSSCFFESIDKDLPNVSDFFAKTSADEKSSSEVYSLPNFVPICTPKKKPEVARSRDSCSADIYRSPGRNNRLLSDLIMNNYSQRQFVVR